MVTQVSESGDNRVKRRREWHPELPQKARTWAPALPPKILGEPTGDGCSVLNSPRVKKQPACVIHTEMGVSDRADASTADERWAGWVARGVAHDRRPRSARSRRLPLWSAVGALAGHGFLLLD